MGDKHRIRFEPVGIEIEADEDETVLDAAFRQGVMLMHGCKEGQCSSCKSFLLDGDQQMERYSTFALADYESDEGYVLLCRVHAYGDLSVELINYDEEMLLSGIPPREARTTVAAVEQLTHDIVRLGLNVGPADELPYRTGQYVDIQVPGTDQWRSFSMAGLSAEGPGGRLEFIIKRYPGGLFSGLLDGTLNPGDPLTVRGPYGTCVMRDAPDRDLILLAGGAGMAPILAQLRGLAATGSPRRTRFYYGARTERDLFALEEIAELGRGLDDFAFVPALSEDGTGVYEQGLITEVVDRHEGDLSGADAYLCGPPPMCDAALELLTGKGMPEERIFLDKFTTSTDT
ncbi:2Fe-2S iron-sulfur cluster binding domain-containing protein [Streptomyces spinosirectus]|uniref:FAD-binding oxidoreductase n=1 Tax=Streptomyces TaxID=1883 RepID=UPI000D341C83|nr:MULTISPECIES: 2Fe-2S iron-sulfur cluster binding domain-containing protein [Streptomyces]MBY8344184.1 2Fe-2S iron-sulfur cluster binding domain-containing protein [Streptomyces plumbidurans]PTM86641.1 propane monooxygenase reductase subunit [Streptomyces sp. VMFN-G11Ma]UIR22677.1 2Fe-2S iron-sulfur cluster binding domain-containing protein [Streptomyces spinosirectus]